MADRAAQFSPFAALTGHDAAVKETARLTEQWVELDEDFKERLNEELQTLKLHLNQRPKIKVTYFNPDIKKEGGEYVTITETVKKINEYERCILLEDETFIPIDRIFDISVLLP